MCARVDENEHKELRENKRWKLLAIYFSFYHRPFFQLFLSFRSLSRSLDLKAGKKYFLINFSLKCNLCALFVSLGSLIVVGFWYYRCYKRYHKNAIYTQCNNFPLERSLWSNNFQCLHLTYTFFLLLLHLPHSPAFVFSYSPHFKYFN